MKELLARITTQLNVYKEKRVQNAIQRENEKENARLAKEAMKKKRSDFRSRFDQLLLTDVKKLVTQSKAIFLENGLELRQESYKQLNRFYISVIYPHLTYVIIEIGSTALRLAERSNNSSCMIYVGDEDHNIIQLFIKKITRPNSDDEYNDLGELVATWHLDDYDVRSILQQQFEKFVKLRIRELEE